VWSSPRLVGVLVAVSLCAYPARGLTKAEVEEAVGVAVMRYEIAYLGDWDEVLLRNVHCETVEAVPEARLIPQEHDCLVVRTDSKKTLHRFGMFVNQIVWKSPDEVRVTIVVENFVSIPDGLVDYELLYGPRGWRVRSRSPQHGLM
jgi:uncharacterized protein YlzI (FlbEa/FlbD family)